MLPQVIQLPLMLSVCHDMTDTNSQYGFDSDVYYDNHTFFPLSYNETQSGRDTSMQLWLYLQMIYKLPEEGFAPAGLQTVQ